MSPELIPFFRSLAILRRLQIGAADRNALKDQVHQDVDADPYGTHWGKAEQKRLENDLARLRGWGVRIDYYEGLYHLIDVGTFTPFALNEAALHTLAFLQETFGPGTPHAAHIQELLQAVIVWLTPAQRHALTRQRQQWRMDLRRRDHDVVDARVEEAVARALDQRRLLRFTYRSPSQEDGQPRQHTVQPWAIHFDTTRRHLYLEAYRVAVAGPHGLWRTRVWQRYRLGRIQAAEIEILPDKFPTTPPPRPTYALEYLLAPEIARLGEISPHFAEMQVYDANEAGWVRVTATTDDLFHAVRLLLGYGPLCQVIGGAEARREIVALVQALHGLYE